MALREFVDSQHVEWKVWDVTPEQMHPVHAREMFHGRYVDYQEGWLVFESATERRRLAPFPSRWGEFPDVEIETLLRMAEVVPPRRTASETQSGQFRRYTEERAAGAEGATASPEASREASREASHDTPAGVVRRFLGPSGRTWSATIVDRGGASVLRFTASDGTACDVERYPEDWSRYTRERLSELLRSALPATGAPAAEGAHPRRRRDDFQP
jgi:hypothetical protein